MGALQIKIKMKTFYKVFTQLPTFIKFFNPNKNENFTREQQRNKRLQNFSTPNQEGNKIGVERKLKIVLSILRWVQLWRIEKKRKDQRHDLFFLGYYLIICFLLFIGWCLEKQWFFDGEYQLISFGQARWTIPSLYEFHRDDS